MKEASSKKKVSEERVVHRANVIILKKKAAGVRSALKHSAWHRKLLKKLGFYW